LIFSFHYRKQNKPLQPLSELKKGLEIKWQKSPDKKLTAGKSSLFGRKDSPIDYLLIIVEKFLENKIAE